MPHSSKGPGMAVAHVLGFPRIGVKRELKLALEAYWRGEIPETGLLAVGRDLRERHWLCQRGAGLDFVTVGDFAWYDSVLQTLAYLGCAPRRFGFDPRSLTLPQYFTLARGDADHPAMEMTKWFDTNYHYLVPEWSAESQFEGGVKWLFDEVMQARELGHAVKVSVVGPLTLLYLGKIKSGLAHKLDLLAQLIPAYQRLLAHVKALGVSWVQVDEPILGLELDDRWLDAFKPTYETQYRFVDLHPGHSQGFDVREQALIGRNELREQIELVRKTGFDLAEVEQGEGAHHGNLDGMAQFSGLHHFVEQPLHSAFELRLRAPFRHEVVVVGVEPLGHLHGRMIGVAARQREILRQRERAGVEAEAARSAPEVREGLQYRVVPGEIADRDEVQPRPALAQPMALAQVPSNCQQTSLRYLAPPIRLQG